MFLYVLWVEWPVSMLVGVCSLLCQLICGLVAFVVCLARWGIGSGPGLRWERITEQQDGKRNAA